MTANQKSESSQSSGGDNLPSDAPRTDFTSSDPSSETTAGADRPGSRGTLSSLSHEQRDSSTLPPRVTERFSLADVMSSIGVNVTEEQFGAIRDAITNELDKYQDELDAQFQSSANLEDQYDDMDEAFGSGRGLPPNVSDRKRQAQAKGPAPISLKGRLPHEISSGIVIRPVARSPGARIDTQRAITKNMRGSTPSERLKTRRIVCVPLRQKIRHSRVSELLGANVDADISAETLLWHQNLEAIRETFEQFDLDGPFMIPDYFNLASPEILPDFTNQLVDYRKVPRHRAVEWQEWVNAYVDNEDLTSVDWAKTILSLSLEPDFKSDVNDIYFEYPASQRGGILLHAIIAELLVAQTQEAKFKLQMWLHNFSITNYDGQDVQVASRRLTSIVKALGDDLPSNAVSLVLKGFAKASSEEFVTKCKTIEALLENSLVSSSLKSAPVAKQVRTIVDDLAKVYHTLSITSNWPGATHVASTRTYYGAGNPSRALVAAGQSSSRNEDSEDYSVFLTFEAAQIYAAHRGRKLSYKEWVKSAICHFCGLVGHIKPECAKWKALSPAERAAWNPKTASGRSAPRSQDTRPSSNPSSVRGAHTVESGDLQASEDLRATSESNEKNEQGHEGAGYNAMVNNSLMAQNFV